MNNLCWYHHQHGTRAKKCSSGCKHYSTFQYPGKLQSGSALNVSDVGPHHQQLFITDSNSGRCFLIDTGAQVSVIPATGREKTISYNRSTTSSQWYPHYNIWGYKCNTPFETIALTPQDWSRLMLNVHC